LDENELGVGCEVACGVGVGGGAIYRGGEILVETIIFDAF